MTTPRPRVRTPERSALLTAEWPAGVASVAILMRYNALPGEPIDIGRLGCEAYDLGLHRPPGFRYTLAPPTLGEALERLSRCPEDVEAARHPVLSEPVPADFATVEGWARSRGIVCTWWDDLGRVNAARELDRLPAFRRVWPERRGVGS